MPDMVPSAKALGYFQYQPSAALRSARLGTCRDSVRRSVGVPGIFLPDSRPPPPMHRLLPSDSQKVWIVSFTKSVIISSESMKPDSHPTSWLPNR
jgi:hypothetical protein